MWKICVNPRPWLKDSITLGLREWKGYREEVLRIQKEKQRKPSELKKKKRKPSELQEDTAPKKKMRAEKKQEKKKSKKQQKEGDQGGTEMLLEIIAELRKKLEKRGQAAAQKIRLLEEANRQLQSQLRTQTHLDADKELLEHELAEARKEIATLRQATTESLEREKLLKAKLEEAERARQKEKRGSEHQRNLVHLKHRHGGEGMVPMQQTQETGRRTVPAGATGTIEKGNTESHAITKKGPTTNDQERTEQNTATTKKQALKRTKTVHSDQKKERTRNNTTRK